MLKSTSPGVSLTPDLSSAVRGPFCSGNERDARIPQLDCVGTEKRGQPLFLDLRPASLFGRGFIPGSINVSTPECLDMFSRFPELTGQRCYVIAASAVHRHAARRLFENYRAIRIAGWLTPDVIREWSRMRGVLASFEEVEADDLAAQIAEGSAVTLNVCEWLASAGDPVPLARHVSLDSLRESLRSLPEETSLSLIGGSSGHAGFAGSLLWRIGYTRLTVLRSGFKAYGGLGLPPA